MLTQKRLEKDLTSKLSALSMVGVRTTKSGGKMNYPTYQEQNTIDLFMGTLPEEFTLAQVEELAAEEILVSRLTRAAARELGARIREHFARR